MKVVLLFLCLFVSSIALAQSSKELPLRGEGTYKWFFLHIYDAKLWAEPGDDLYLKPLYLELKYARDLKGKDIAEQSIKEIKKAGLSNINLKDLQSKLLAIFPDVKTGDVIKAQYHPETGVSFYLNSTLELGQLLGADDSKSFLDIWLGKKTSSPELTNKLLGNNK